MAMTVYARPSLLLNRELLRYEPAFLKLLVRDTSEHEVRWLLIPVATIRQRLRLIVSLKSH